MRRQTPAIFETSAWGRAAKANLALLGALALFLILGTAGASAFTYGPGVPPAFCTATGVAPGSCEEQKGVAVDQSNGHVYAIDANSVAGAGNYRISEYTSAGVFVKGFGIAVADGVTLSPQVCIATCFAGKETGVGAVGTGARGIAVDPTTHIVYFVAGAAKVVYYDGTTGAFLGEFTGTENTSPVAPAKFASTTGVAVDSSNPAQHYLYVATGTGANSVIDKFKVPVPAGPTLPAYVCQITGKETASATECHVTASKDGAFNGLSFTGQQGAILATDATGNVYVAEEIARNTVSVFDSTGAFVKALTTPSPVAVASGPTDRIFAVGSGLVTGGGTVQEIKVSTGVVISEIVLPASGSLGVAVDTSGLSSNGSVYVTEKVGKQLWKYRLVPRKLKVVKTGSGTGTVTSVPAGINCGAECEKEFSDGTEVTLSGVPGPNTKPVEWEGCDAIVGANECKVTLTADKEVKAKFALETHLLTVTKSGTGTGTVTSSPAGINCGATCSAAFDHASAVTLTGTPAGGSKAVVWSGCDAIVGANQCQVTMSAAKGVTAKFDLALNFALTVNKAGSGAGTVSCDGGSCAATYVEGSKVTLTASPDSNSTFAGWSGGGCSGTGTCVVTMSAATTVTATFDAKPVTHPDETPKPAVKCVVPKLKGLALGKAKSALAAAHCTLGKVTKPKPKKGKKLGPLVVKSSSPAAAAELAENGKVNLKLGPKPKKKK